MTLRVVLEISAKRSFASALDWPGWSRSGSTPEDAIETLLAYAPRYAAVAARGGVDFQASADRDGVEIVERLDGNATTAFGAPAMAAAAEEQPVSADDLERLSALLEASWATLDAAASEARGVELATGPRGGGRELGKILEHVRDAERAYLSKLGLRAPGAGDRHAFLHTLRARARGEPIADPSRTRRPWSPRYAVRRAAWHVLDHAWEIEDRAKR